MQDFQLLQLPEVGGAAAKAEDLETYLALEH